MLSRRDGSRVTSERAEYVLATAGELVELTGNPHWRETLREAKADRFELRRPASKQEPQVLQAIGHAWIKMPAATNAAAGFTLQQTPPSPAPSNATRVFELSAGIVTLVMPLTNGPVQGVEAATNVVITDPQAGWRATAGRAVFTNATLELTGSPEWNEGDRLVRGDTLTLTTSPQSFAATGHAHMQFPVQLATNAVPGLGRTARPGRSFGTNLLVSVDADRAIFRDGKLVFHAPVEARLHAGDKPLGRLLCRDLTISYPGHVEAAQAEGDVRIEQFATATEGGTSREIRCERLRVDFDAAGQPRSLAAEGGVDGRQTETHAKRPEPVVTTVRADRLDARFIAGTNHIEIATAAGGVELQQAGRKATGQQAVFTGADGCVTLTGTPRVETPEGRIADTTSLTYDTRQKRFRGQGPFRIEWTRVPTNFGMPTNFTRLKNKFLPAK
jgi:lipopolysaccharide export system protein LptA